MSQDTLLFESWHMQYRITFKKNFVLVPVCDILLKYKDIEIKQMKLESIFRLRLNNNFPFLV